MAGKQRSGSSLSTWILAITSLLIVLTAGVAIVMISILVGDVGLPVGGNYDHIQRRMIADLDAGQSAQAALEAQRKQRLLLISRIFSTDEVLTSYLAEAAEAGDRVSVLDSVETYQNLLAFDLAVVLDRDGRVLTRTDDPNAVGEDLSGSTFIAAALESDEAFGVWYQGEKLYHAAAVPLARDFVQVGYIVVAFAIDDRLARQIQRVSGTDVVFLANSPTGPAAVASTLPGTDVSELLSALRREGDVIGRVTRQGDTVSQVELSLAGEPWLAVLMPLADAAAGTVGASVALTRLTEKLADYRQIQLVLVATGGLALILALVASLWLGRRAMVPIRQLAAAAEQAAHGNYEVALPEDAGGDLGQLAGSLASLLRQLREKLALDAFVGRVSRQLPEPARGAVATRPQTRDTTLLAIEMRRFANPKIGYDPEENLGRFSRDLQRISAVAASHQGRVEAVFGHRVLAVFDGETGPAEGLAAATEILHMLGERENVFDEPDPPAVAATCGNVVSGSVVWGDHPSGAFAGLPVQQLESLIREAQPGEIYLSKPIAEKLLPAIRNAGVQVRAQRGLLSPLPLVVLDLETASKVTGVSTAPQTAAGFPGERRSLGDVKPGVLLGNRFEVLAQLGAGRVGLIFKAQDRDLGDLVTLKMLKPEIVQNAAQFDHLKQVIGRARGVRHPNVLGVLDFGETDSMPYISMEFARGMTLRFVIEQSRQVPVAAGLQIARQIGFALAEAHSQQLLHGGLKPENVLVETAGSVKVMDFGLALPGGSGIEYLAPEQLEGKGAQACSDVYGWGAVVYQMLTGQLPYAGSSVAELRQKHVMEDPAPPSTLCELPGELEQILLRSLARAPEQRYPTIGDLLSDLGQVRV